MRRRWTVYLARVLALGWAAFWLFFFVVESLVYRTPAPVMASWGGWGCSSWSWRWCPGAGN
ncbi:MAG: hypothetical protein ACE141_14840 [Bryobacteraceae bacterium]